jgi:ATP sulfurylase
MAKLFELPAEQSICCIPLRHAVYCRTCRTISNSRPLQCSLCGSGKVIRLEGVLNGSPDPPAQNCRAARPSLVRAIGA